MGTVNLIINKHINVIIIICYHNLFFFSFSAQSYAIGIFNWHQKEATINPAKLYHVKYFLNSFMIFGYLHTGK